jgi:drug/metabolite transporter (DMT)-like permease
MILVRFAIAYLLLLPFAIRQGYRLRHSLEPRVFWYGFTGIVLFFGFQNIGLLFTSAVSTVLVQSIVPATTALFACAFLGERLSPRRIAGIALALAGSVLVALTTRSTHAGSNPLLGNLLVFGSVLAWGVYTTQGKRLGGQIKPVALTVASFGSALLVLLPLAAGEIALQGWPRLTLPSLAAVLYLGIVVSGLTMWLWNVAISLVEASVAGLYINLMGVVGVAIALLAGETISPGQVLGGAIVLAGVLLSGRPRRG